MKLFDHTAIPTLSKALQAYTLRHQAISSNIANIGTAGYSPKVVRFEEQLAASTQGGPAIASSTTDPRHIGFGDQPIRDVQPSVEDMPSSGKGLVSGVNEVDIDQEMAELAKNQLRYKFSSRMLSESFRALQKSIRGTV
jgi:flagellar basal-body rod protein FlgB